MSAERRIGRADADQRKASTSLYRFRSWNEKIYSLPQRLLRLLNRWDIQPISGALRTSNRDPQRQSQRIKGRQLALHLGQVRSVILARTNLKQAVWTGVNRATDRGTIQQRSHLHVFQLRQPHRHIVTSFAHERFNFVHDARVASILLTVQENERTMSS